MRARRLRRALVGVGAVLSAAAIAATSVVGTPAAARPLSAGSPAAPLAVSSADSGLDMALTALSPAVPQAGNTLTVTGTLADAGSATYRDLQIYLRIPGTPITDRAGLSAIATTAPGDPATAGGLQLAHYTQLGALRPGGRTTFTLVVAIDALGLSSPGVYPVTVEARGTNADGARVAAADVRTYLPWRIGADSGTVSGSATTPTATAGDSTVVQGSWLVPLTTAAVRVSDSVFVDGTLAASLASGGRLGRILALLTQVHDAGRAAGAGQPGTTVQVAIDPMLIAEVRAMTGPYRVVDSSSPTATGRSAAVPVATPTTAAPTPLPSPTPHPGATLHPGPSTATRSPTGQATSPTSVRAPTTTDGGSTTTGGTTTGNPATTGSPATATTGAAGAPSDTLPTTTALADADLPAVHTRPGHGQALARRWLAGLRTVLTGRTVFVLPWSDPDLGAVADPRAQLGRTALAGTWAQGLAEVRALGADPVPLAWPSLGTDTAAELTLAGRSGATTVLLPNAALSGAGAPTLGSSALATLSRAPAGSPVQVLRADSGLDTALAALNPLLGRQSYLAQTALLATAAGGGVTGTGDPRPSHPVLAVLPRDWDPEPDLVAMLLLTPPSWLRQGPELSARAGSATSVLAPTTTPGSAIPSVTLRQHLAVLARQHPRDPAADTPVLTAQTRNALGQLARQTATLADLLTEPAGPRRGLRAQRLQLASADLVDRPLRWHRLAGAVAQTVEGIRAGVRLVPPNAVSLSNGTGEFPVIVVNSLDQPVRVRLEMSTANDLRLRVASIPATTLPADERSTLEVLADTHTHGLVEVRAVLEDGTGAALGAPLSFAVHSNSYDGIGWVIIVTAGVLLFGATAVRLVRRIHGHARRERG
jgi:hypothetical protein